MRCKREFFTTECYNLTAGRGWRAGRPAGWLAGGLPAWLAGCRLLASRPAVWKYQKNLEFSGMFRKIPEFEKPLERQGLKSCDFMDGRYQWERNF